MENDLVKVHFLNKSKNYKCQTIVRDLQPVVCFDTSRFKESQMPTEILLPWERILRHIGGCLQTNPENTHWDVSQMKPRCSEKSFVYDGAVNLLELGNNT